MQSQPLTIEKGLGRDQIKKDLWKCRQLCTKEKIGLTKAFMVGWFLFSLLTELCASHNVHPSLYTSTRPSTPVRNCHFLNVYYTIPIIIIADRATPMRAKTAGRCDMRQFCEMSSRIRFPSSRPSDGIRCK